MLTREEAHRFAEHWITAWNAHDLDRIMAHYETEVELSSPVRGWEAQPEGLFPEGAGCLSGAPLRAPRRDVGREQHRALLCEPKGHAHGEYMELSPRGKVLRVAANYSG